MNVNFLSYDVIKDVATERFRLSEDDEEPWDLCWYDLLVTPNQLMKIKPHQKTNHFPGMYNLAKKNLLGKNLMKMRKAMPNEFDFFPPTWILPYESNEFKA